MGPNPPDRGTDRDRTMSGGRLIHRNDPTISPDPRVRASVGVGNDCEPYADFGFTIAPPGVVLPNCNDLDVLRSNPWFVNNPAVPRILETAYTDPDQNRRFQALGAIGLVGELRRGNLLGPEAFQDEESRKALERSFNENPFAQDLLVCVLRGDCGVKNEGPPPVGVATPGMDTTMQNVMVPPAPDMGGVWDSRASAGDVDSARAFNEPVRIGTGQAPLAYSAPFVAAVPESDNSFLTLISLAGLALALWRNS